METTVDGNSLTSDGTHRINPSDPNRLSGSYSKTWQNVTETISWNLQKCAAPLRITDLQFEDMRYPNWNDWQEISEQKGTVDGNLVKIKAKVLNASGETKYADVRFKETYKGDKWDGAKPDAPLKDAVVFVRVEANSEETVELLWDSSGYAWFDDGRPRLVQRIKAELEENSKKIDEQTRNLKVAPKPPVLVHGLWSNWQAWEPWQNVLTTAHSYDWKAFPVGEKAEYGKMNTGGAFLSTEQTNSIGENAESKSIHTDLTGTSDFSAFVKPRLAIGPKGNYNPEAPELPQSSNQTGAIERNPFVRYFVNASYKQQPVSLENPINQNVSAPYFAKAVKLGAKQTLEIEIPVQSANNCGLTFMAAPEISATLFDDKGTVAGKSLAKTPEANAWFRSIYFDKAVTNQIWKLKLENTSDLELEAILTTWKDAAK